MNFKKLLIHRCTLLTEGESTAEDDYGRPIPSTIESINTPCRVDQIRERVASDDTGNDFILSNVLFLDETQTVSLTTRIFHIEDLQGNPVLTGSFVVKNINPVYGRRKLHHTEVTLQRE